MIYEHSLIINARGLSDPVDGGRLESLFGNSHREREVGLMLAVLEDAIECFQKYVAAEDKRGKAQFDEAEEWILEKNSDWFFSFENVCAIVRLDPDYLRQGLLRWKEARSNVRPDVKICSLAGRKKRKDSTLIDSTRKVRVSA
jgi:hypothetical protein